MRHHAIAWHPVPLAVLAFLLLVAGCSGKQLSSSVQDQTLVPPEEVAEPAPEPEPAPIEEAFVPPEPEPMPEPMMEEPFAPEPEMMLEPEPMPEMEPEPFTPEPFVEEPAPEPMEEAFMVPEPEPFMPEPEPFVPEPEPMPEPEPELAPVIEEAQVPEPEPFMPEPEPMEEMPVEPEPPVIEEVTPEPLPPPEPLVLDDVYFDFDRFTIRSDAQMALEANARRLRDDEDWTLTIEGHCDERGTIAYNLVLGERRAEAVKRYLEDLGVPGWKINIVSYGKEKPFCQDHNEDCWQENRRAHFVY